MTDSLRGKAAIVGVADLASPTGELELHGRALEVAMIKAALDDAGLTIDDVDGVCHTAVVDGARRVPAASLPAAPTRR